MKKDRGCWVYVDPDFRKLLKVESAKRGESMVELTRKIGKSSNLLDDVDEGNKVERRKPFSFRI